MGRGGSFKGRQVTAAVVLWVVRWYLQFPISYRDLELLLQDRGVSVDQTTIFRWVQAYSVEPEMRLRHSAAGRGREGLLGFLVRDQLDARHQAGTAHVADLR